MKNNLKKILGSVFTLGVVAIVAVVATQAFFSDEETSVGNTFAAGAIDLKIDNTSYGFDWNDPNNTNPNGTWGQNSVNSWASTDLTDQKFFSFSDLKPGDYGEDTISLLVNSNDAYACMAFDLTSTPDNGITGPEAGAGDATDGENGGELQNYLSFLFWYDDGDNVLEVGETVIPELSGLPGSVFTGGWLPIAESGDTPLPANTTRYIGKGWCFGEMTQTPVARDLSNNDAPVPGATGFTCNGAGEHNVAQTDGIVVDVHFHAVQSRNNEGFLCSSLPPVGGGEQLPQVGTNLESYTAPTCNVTLSGGTIQAAVDAIGDNQTLCVPDGTYNETVVINHPMTLAALNGPLNSATIQGGVNVKSSGVTVTGFIISPGSILGENTAVYLDGGISSVNILYNDLNGLDEDPSRGVVTVTSGSYSAVSVAHNVIHDFTTGIYTNPGTNSISVMYNDFYDNSAGIGGFTGAHVKYNEFKNGGEAIGADSSYDGSVVEYNNFLDDSRLNTYVSISGDVMAENNFWGPNGGAAQTGGTDEVDFTPEAGAQFPHN